MVSLLVWSAEGLLIFILLAGTLSIVEFFRLMGLDWRRWEMIIGLMMWQAACFITYYKLFRGFEHYQDILLGIGLLLLPILSITLLYRKNMKAQFEVLAHLLLGLVYVGVPFLLLLVVASMTPGLGYDYRLPLGFFFLLWMSDTSAYAFGRLWGRTKIFPRHSPKKSWEGFGGAIVCTVALGFFLEQFWPQHGFHWWIMGLIVSVFGLYGDLAESMLKRSADAKDSGSILPGHGGMLDRFDGMLVALPVVVFYLLLLPG